MTADPDFSPRQQFRRNAQAQLSVNTRSIQHLKQRPISGRIDQALPRIHQRAFNTFVTLTGAGHGTHQEVLYRRRNEFLLGGEMVLHSALRKARGLGHPSNCCLGVTNLCQQSNGRVADILAGASAFQLLQSLFRSHTFPLLKPKRYHKKPYGWLFILLALRHWEILREALGESACRS